MKGGMIAMLIKSVKFLPDFIIEIELVNRQKMIYDIKSYINSAKLCGIESQEFFEKGRLIENSYIEWDENNILYDYEILGKDLIRKMLYHNS